MLANVLDIRGCRPISFVAETTPELKSGNPFGGTCRTHRLRKMSRVGGMIGWVYENAVNNQRAREGKPCDPVTGEVEHFTPEARRWGVRRRRVDGSLSPFVDHKGETYLEVKVERSLQCEYRLDDGTPVDASLVEPWLPNKPEGRRQMVDKPVILRDYSLSNIREVTINGETHVTNG
jgi:hypothetical protein